MASGKKLGLFWGSGAFSILESNQDAPVKNFRVPYAPVAAEAPSTTTQADDARIAALLKDALKANKVTLTDVYLSLPSKDIVIRSFIIPALKPHEIKGVVEFEIKKYIPFNLKELAYSFHASPLIEDKVKRMRVHFVAIRRENLEHYSAILKQAGLNVVFSEPAPMCLTRALIAKKFIKPDQKVAVVQTDFNDSRIIVFDGGVVQFVRDFQIYNPALNAPMPEPELLKKKLFNEIKISLDFYMRQFKSEKIGEVVTISFDPTQDIVDQLQQELETPVRKVDPNQIVNAPDATDIGIINSFGAVLAPAPKTAVFNLSGSVVVPGSKQKLAPSIQIPEEYLPAVKVGVISAVIVLGMFILTNFNVAQTKKKYDVLLDQDGAFLDMSVDTIQQKVTENNSKLELHKSIFRKTEMTSLLMHVSKTLPNGVWLTELTVQYIEITDNSNAPGSPSKDASGGLTLDAVGYAYSKDSNQQFRMVYGLVNAFKADELFKKYIKNVTLASIQNEQVEDVSMTSFRINAK